MIKVQRGNTARLTALIKDFDGAVLAPDSINFKVFDHKYQQISSTPVSLDNRTSSGKYFTYYQPEQNGMLIIEWHCVKDGIPSLCRSKMLVEEV